MYARFTTVHPGYTSYVSLNTNDVKIVFFLQNVLLILSISVLSLLHTYASHFYILQKRISKKSLIMLASFVNAGLLELMRPVPLNLRSPGI